MSGLFRGEFVVNTPGGELLSSDGTAEADYSFLTKMISINY